MKHYISGTNFYLANGHSIENVNIEISWHKQMISHIWCEGKRLWTDEDYKYFGINAEMKIYTCLKDAYEYIETIITNKVTNKRMEILGILKNEFKRLKEERRI